MDDETLRTELGALAPTVDVDEAWARLERSVVPDVAPLERDDRRGARRRFGLVLAAAAVIVAAIAVRVVADPAMVVVTPATDPPASTTVVTAPAPVPVVTVPAGTPCSPWILSRMTPPTIEATFLGADPSAPGGIASVLDADPSVAGWTRVDPLPGAGTIDGVPATVVAVTLEPDVGADRAGALVNRLQSIGGFRYATFETMPEQCLLSDETERAMSARLRASFGGDLTVSWTARGGAPRTRRSLGRADADAIVDLLRDDSDVRSVSYLDAVASHADVRCRLPWGADNGSGMHVPTAVIDVGGDRDAMRRVSGKLRAAEFESELRTDTMAATTHALGVQIMRYDWERVSASGYASPIARLPDGTPIPPPSSDCPPLGVRLR